MIGIISLLESISGDDDACVNACIGMLNALYGVVHYLRDDPKDRPYALAMISYIHVVRYDTFLEKHPELVASNANSHIISDLSELSTATSPSSSSMTTTQPQPQPSESPYFPQFIIFGHELARAISMLEDACNIISETHEKRSWLYLTLCRAVRSAMLQSESDPASFAGWTNKLAQHVRQVGGAGGRDVGVFTSTTTAIDVDKNGKITGFEDVTPKRKPKDFGKIDPKAKQDAVDTLLGEYLPGQLEWERGLVEYAETALLKEKAGLVGYAGHALLRVYGFTKKREFLDEAIEMLEEAAKLEAEWEKDKEKTDKWMNMDLGQPQEAAVAQPSNEVVPAKSSISPGKGKGKNKGGADAKAAAAASAASVAAATPNSSAASSTSTFIAMGMGIIFPKGVPKSLTEPKKPKPKPSPAAQKGSLYSDLASALIARYNEFEPHDPRDMTRAIEVQLVTIQLLMADTDEGKAERLNTLGYDAFEHAGKVGFADDADFGTRLVQTAITAFEEALRVVGGNIKEKCSILNHLAAALQQRYSMQMKQSTSTKATDEFSAPNPKELARIQTALAKSLRIAPPNDPNRLSHLVNYARFFLFKFAALAGPAASENPAALEPQHMDTIRQAVDLYAEAVALALVQRRVVGAKKAEAADAPGPPKDKRHDPKQVIIGLHLLGTNLLGLKRQILALDPEGVRPNTAHRILAMCKDVLRMVDDSEPRMVEFIMEVSNSVLRYADGPPSLAEVQDNLAMSERARRMAKDGSEDMLTVLHGMAVAHATVAKFSVGGDREVVDTHLEAAFPILLKALELVELYPEHQSVSHIYSILGNAYIMRYNRNLEKDNGEGDLRKKYVMDLENSSDMYREFVKIAGRIAPEGAVWANELATAYLNLYDEFEELSDLDTAMTRLEWCIFYPRLVPPSVTGGVQPNEPAPTVTDLLGRQDSIRSLFCGRFARFYFRGELQDFKNGMLTMSLLQTLRKAGPTADGVGWSENDPDGETLFEYLAEYFTLNFETTADVDGVVKEFAKQATVWSKDVSAQPPNKFEVAALMDPLVYLSIRLGRMHGKSRIKPEVLDQLESGVRLISETHPKKATCLQFVGDMQTQHFVFANKLKHISVAISSLREAVRLSKDMPTYPERATFFGQALLHRFRLLGDMSDINEAVSALKQALVVAQAPERVKFDLLNRYGNALYERYGRFSDFEDLNKALQIFQIAKQTPMRSGEKIPDAVESALQSVLDDNTDSTPDAERTISLFKKENDWMKTLDWSKLNDYGNALLHRFSTHRELGDVNKAILVFERALDRAKGDRETKVQILKALAFSLTQQYSISNDVRDISRCITYLQEALKQLPVAHPAKGDILFDLGRWLPVRFEKTRDSRDLEKAYGYLRSAASQHFSNMVWRFRAASLWAYWVRHFNQGDLLSAYRLSMELLPQLTWLGISTPVRQTQLTEVVTVVGDAVAVALQDRQEVTAVEWFEQGRSVIWGQLNQLRVPVKDLSSLHPAHAEKLQAINDKIHFLSNSRFEEVKVGKRGEEGGERYYDLVQERDMVLKEIRSMDGFSNYMQPPKLHDLLRDCRLEGPVIMVNVSTSACDALIVMPKNGSASHIPLPDFTYADAADLNQSLQNILGRSASSRRPSQDLPSRQTKKRITSEVVFENMLSKLWLCVVKPILNGLGMKVNCANSFQEGYLPFDCFQEPRKDNLPRVWWSLSGPLAFLPIHAAGLYSARHRSPGNKLADFAVSSYAPSLSALVNAARRTSNTVPKLLTVAFPDDPDLPATQDEIGAISKHGSSSVIKLSSSEATVDHVVSHLKDCGFVHFACHGVQKLDNPLDSSLLLTGRSSLSLAKLSTLHLPQAEFAFLSACQTAASDPLVSEESVHLGAGVFVAGYRSVIATMWSTVDEDGPVIADSVYAHLFRKERGAIDATDAAYALHVATKRLRESSPQKSYLAWLPYVHIGV